MSRKRKSWKSNDEDVLYVSRAGWYSLNYPAEWHVQEEEECITIYDPHMGVGALQISAYRTPTHQNPREILVEYLLDNQIHLEKRKIVVYKVEEKSMATYDYIKDQWYKKIWFVSQGSYLFLITYNCKLERQGEEMEKIEKIVHSIEVGVPV